MTALRPATADDAGFLAEMLAIAADWRVPDPRPVAEVLADTALAHYVTGWARPGDGGVIAERDEAPVGAAWWRLLTASDPGYGYVDDDTPELSIGVIGSVRGSGVGRRLLDAAIEAAERQGAPALSLSVEIDNPAVRLYERVGFEVVGTASGAHTMTRRLGSGTLITSR